MEIRIWNILKPLLMKTCYKILINTKEETNLKDIIKVFRAKNKVLKDDSGYKKNLLILYCIAPN